MKTIREIFADSRVPEDEIVAELEAREKERDAAERERVKAAISEAFMTKFNVPKQSYLLDEIYPPPEPKKLPAGYYWNRHKEYHPKWVCGHYQFAFDEIPGWEYRRWDDPPPEVTGKSDSRCTVCGHAEHGNRVCFNMASDNDCDCKGPQLERVRP